MTALFSAVVALAGAAWIFWAGSEIALVVAQSRLERGLRPGQAVKGGALAKVASAHSHARPMLRLSRELSWIAALLCAAAAGVLVAIVVGAS